MEKSKFEQLDKLTNAFSGSTLETIFGIYRAIRVREEYEDYLNIDQQDLIKRASEITSVPPFAGDERIFYSVFMEIISFSKRDCLEYFDHIIAKDKKSDILPVPRALSNLFFSSIGENTRRIFIPDCERYGVYLYDLLLEKMTNMMFTTSCRIPYLEEVYHYLFSGLNIRFITGDIYKYGFTDDKFDLIVCFPIMGGRFIFDELDFISKDPSLIAAQNLLYHLTSEGSLRILMPAKVTFGGGDTESFRKYIEENYKINEIISLPNKLFQPFLFINTYLLSFSIGETEDIKLRKYSLLQDKNLSDDNLDLKVEEERIIFKDEFELIPSWNVEIFFSSDDEEICAYTNSSVKKSPIGLIASVFRGKSVNEKANDGIINVVNISNITDIGIDYSNLDSFNEDERKVNKYFLEEGDVLVTARGTTVKIAVFEKQHKPCVASSNINVIRLDKMLKGEYLKLFLDSSVGKKMLKTLQRGTAILNINYKDIEMLEVPIPPLDLQEALIAEYQIGRDIYARTLKSAEEEWLKIQKNIERKLY